MIAATAWAIHQGTRPFDDRHAGLIDSMEEEGLRTRVSVFFLIQVMLIGAASSDVTTIVAGTPVAIVNEEGVAVKGLRISCRFWCANKGEGGEGGGMAGGA